MGPGGANTKDSDSVSTAKSTRGASVVGQRILAVSLVFLLVLTCVSQLRDLGISDSGAPPLEGYLTERYL